MELGQRLKQARLEAGLSQRQLCGDTITRNMLSQIENGSAKPSMATLQYLSARLGKPVSFFLEEITASPNQSRMAASRTAYAAGDHSAVLACLQDYSAPDPVFDAEFHLLRALSFLAQAEQEPDRQCASQLLSQCADAGSHTPYYTPELERRRLLRLSQVAPEDSAVIADILPPDDRELLLRARAALDRRELDRCTALLCAACDRSSADWLLLRADAAELIGDHTTAEQCYLQAEKIAPQQVYPRLEQFYLQQENYKLAYHYATKQRKIG